MRRRKRGGTPEQRVGPVDTAWYIHAALVDWTGKVDVKANFVLALESALLGGIITFTGKGRRLAQWAGWQQLVLFWAGVALLSAGVLAVVTVVAPRLRSRRLRYEWRDNHIYFGHLRYWEPEALQSALERGDELPGLSRQLVAMSTIAWRKHRRLQASVWLAVAGIALVGTAAALNG